MHMSMDRGTGMHESSKDGLHSIMNSRSLGQSDGSKAVSESLRKDESGEVAEVSGSHVPLSTEKKVLEREENEEKKSNKGKQDGAGQRLLGENSALPPPQQQHTTISEAVANGGGPRKRMKISWKCGMCGYHVLAMDQEGRPLPLSVSPFGEVLPMSCPQCLLEHTSWEQSVPFDEYGDHANIRSKLSNNYVRMVGQSGAEVKDLRPPSTQRADGVREDAPRIPQILQDIGCWSSKEGAEQQQQSVKDKPRPRGARKAYYCSKCNRQLLRLDPYGELIPLVRDKDGSVLPIMCPGCKIEHNEWEVRPFTVTR